MATYRNLSNTTKTFHGVTFKPGEIKECPGLINHNQFIKVKSVAKEPPKRTESKPKDVQPKPEPKPQKKQETEPKVEVNEDVELENVQSENKEE